ncbi:MAG: hypothetical protein HQL08_15455 [Nitrospirae bacterium]|nr:hypothetical protein [Nitrospirota bacterium]
MDDLLGNQDLLCEEKEHWYADPNIADELEKLREIAAYGVREYWTSAQKHPKVSALRW